MTLVVNASSIKPQYELEASKMVTDLFIEGDTLYAATSGGIVDIFSISKKEHIGKIELPSVKDFLGDLMPPKIYSIDKIGSKIVLVSQGRSGFRDVYIKDGDTLTRIIDSSDEFFLKKGLFIDENRII